MSWKVLITARTFEEVGASAHELLKNAGCQVIIPSKFGPLPASEIIPQLDGIDAVLASPDQYSAEVLSSPALRQLKVISRWGVGYDSIDINEATRQGIVVAYTPGMLNESVADYTFALLLAIARRLHEGHAAMRNGEWKLLWGQDISGKTLGIIGCGRIGLAVARRAAAFNMQLLGCDPAPSPEVEKLGIKVVSVDELLARSDYVSLHAALTPANRCMIGEKQLKLMKRTAFLINAARGALIDESALIQALHEGWIAGAALDTFTKEPMAADHPLRKAPNVLLAPHLASFARDTGEQVTIAAARAILKLIQGQRPEWVVNPDVFASPTLRVRMSAS